MATVISSILIIIIIIIVIIIIVIILRNANCTGGHCIRVTATAFSIPSASKVNGIQTTPTSSLFPEVVSDAARCTRSIARLL